MANQQHDSADGPDLNLCAIEKQILSTQRDRVTRAILQVQEIGPETDFKIICENGTLHVHSQVLIASCDYFNRFIQSNKSMTYSGYVEAEKIIINFLYGMDNLSHLPIEFVELLEIITTSYMMNLKELWTYCFCKLVIEFLRVETFIEIWMLAEYYEIVMLNKKIEKFGRNNFEKIVKIETLVFLRESALLSLLLLVDQKEYCDLIAETVMIWILADPINREDQSEKLVKIIQCDDLTCDCLRKLFNDYLEVKNVGILGKMLWEEIYLRE